MSISLKARIDNFIMVAADCDMCGRAVDTHAKQQAFELRSSELRRVASALRADIIHWRHSDVEFLTGKASNLRELAASTVMDIIRSELLAISSVMTDCVAKPGVHPAGSVRRPQ
jgi:hypothetical protein